MHQGTIVRWEEHDGGVRIKVWLEDERDHRVAVAMLTIDASTLDAMCESAMHAAELRRCEALPLF